MKFSKDELPRQILGGLISLLGLTVMLGWLLHVPRMTEFITGSVPMVFDAGLCFALAGFGLGGYRIARVSVTSVQTAVGVVVLLVGGICLVEHLLDLAPVIDFPSLHTWYNYGNTRPGRMAPNTATGFMTIGAALILCNRISSRRRALSALILTYGLLAIGLTGLGGYFLGPDILFGWARSARMALHTSAGMILSAVALRFGWHQADWYQSQRYLSERQKIAFSGIAVLLVAIVTAGLGGFISQQQMLQVALKQRLSSLLEVRAGIAHGMVGEALANSHRATSDGMLARAGLALLNRTQERQFPALAGQLAADGFRSVALLDAQRRVVFAAGAQSAASAVEGLLAASPVTGSPASLMWSNGRYILRTEVPLMAGDTRAGSVRLEQELAQFQAQVLGTQALPASLEIDLCKVERSAVECFPNGRRDKPFITSALTADGKPLPIALGVAGQPGSIDMLDERNIRVAAAFRSLGGNLAMAVQQDSAELYGEVRHALRISVLLMIAIAVCSAVLLHAQLMPLTQRLLNSEAKLAALARIDTLTGVPNRYALNEHMLSAIYRQRRSDQGKGIAIMFLDVDRFKSLNDTLGHAGGDVVLKEFAERLKMGVRLTDTVARLAGDEFVIVAEGLHEMREAEIIATAVLDKVNEPWYIEGQQLQITTSIGLAFFAEGDVNPEHMLAKADAGLYRAKENGRNGFAWG